MLVLRTRRCTYPNSLFLMRSCVGADGGKFGCDCSCKCLPVLIGIAEAMVVDVPVEVLGTLSEGGEGDNPAGEATEEGKM